jgi:ferredoxin-like protein FixX
MEQSNIVIALNYATSLIGVPYRWYDEEKDKFNGMDKFWCENSSAPTVVDIIANDKSIVCTGLINLLRRKISLKIPGLNGNISGKYKDLYKKYPGGTGAWFLYLYQRNRLQKLNMKIKYPKGTLLLAKFKNNETDQGHLAVVYSDNDAEKTVNDQLIIHSCPNILYSEKDKHKNHGNVKVEPFYISNDAWKYKKKSYYTHVCYPENWLLLD